MVTVNSVFLRMESSVKKRRRNRKRRPYRGIKERLESKICHLEEEKLDTSKQLSVLHKQNELLKRLVIIMHCVLVLSISDCTFVILYATFMLKFMGLCDLTGHYSKQP